jgi:hypothetical protein
MASIAPLPQVEAEQEQHFTKQSHALNNFNLKKKSI